MDELGAAMCADAAGMQAALCDALGVGRAMLGAPLDPRSSFWVGHVALCLLIATVVLWRAGKLRGMRGWWRAMFPAQIWRQPSVRQDAALLVLNKVVYAALFAPKVAFAMAVAAATSGGLGALLGPMETPLPATTLWVGLFTLFEVLLTDLGLFINHWINHKVRALWAFHKVHHSAPVLTPLTADRFHVCEVLQDALVMELIAGVVIGVGHYLSAGALQVWHVLWVNVLDFVWVGLGSHLRHSHVWWTYPRWLSHILISPAMHQIHHSASPRHYDTNLGVIFAVWDWIAGTLYIPNKDEGDALDVGLSPDEVAGYETVWGMLTSPFTQLVQRARSALEARSARRPR